MNIKYIRFFFLVSLFYFYLFQLKVSQSLCRFKTAISCLFSLQRCCKILMETCYNKNLLDGKESLKFVKFDV